MIVVEKLKIQNYKCFRDFEIEFNDGISIIVGNKEEGKSTILEALQLALSGMLNGRTLFTDVYESLFNKDAWRTGGDGYMFRNNRSWLKYW